ncbi:phage tail tape measure protein [Streptomyces albidoflavus]|uniref:phage tail tape measure protein n=1 Tax=Streptomyces albidoflavus TaxID=1886 RepID=UPI0033E79EF5
MAVEVGMGYVSIVPEVQGFARELQNEVTRPAAQAGDRAGEQAGEGFKSKMGGALKGGLAAIGLAAGAVLMKGFSDAIDQTAVEGTLGAKLGVTEKEAAAYGKSAGQLYARGVTDSVQEAADALALTMRAGILPPGATNKQIESITGKVTDLAKTFELDLGQATNAVGQMMKTGIAKDGGEALDILTKGLQQMGPRADDIADTFNEYSTIFRSMGLSAQEATGLMSQGMKAGARDTDVVADAIKEFSIEAVAGSDRVRDGFEAIGFNADKMFGMIDKGGPQAKKALQMTLDQLRKMEDPQKRNAAAAELFGTKAEDLADALWALDPSKAVAELGKFDGAAKRMGDSLHDNASARITQFKRNAEVALTNFIGDKVIPALTGAASTAKEVFGPAFESAKGFVGDFFSAVKGPGSGALSWLKTTVTDTATSLRDALSPGVRGAVTTFREDLWPTLQGVARVIRDELWPAIQDLIGGARDALAPIFSKVAAIVTEVLWPAMMRLYGVFMENVQPILSKVADFIRDRVVPAFQDIGGKIAELVEKARPLIEVIVEIVSFLGQLVGKIVGTVIPWLIELAGPIFTLLFDAIGWAIGLIGDLIGWLGDLGQGFLDIIAWIGEMAKGARRKLDEFADWMYGLGDRIRGWLGDAGDWLYRVGQDIVYGLWEGIQSLGGWLYDQLQNFALAAIPAPLRDALQIHSPSRLMAKEVGRFIPPGIIEGIDQAQPELDARLKAMVRVPRLNVPQGRRPVDADTRIVAFQRALERAMEAMRGDQRDIVLRIGEQEIARATAAGARQIARR